MLVFDTTYNWKDIIKKIVSIFVNYCYNCKYFWFRIAHYGFWCEYPFINLLPSSLQNKIIRKKFHLIYSFLEKKYINFINKYKTKKIKTWINTKKIFVMWRQWYENMPEIVRICYKSIQDHSCGFEVVLLTKHNYKNYINLPEFILKKVSKWLISITHLSDIIRMRLLSLYWWIRIDATMYICSDVLNKFLNTNLNTTYTSEWNQKHMVFDKWTTFFIWWTTNRLFSFVYDFLIQYHKDYDKIVNYFLVDYAIHLAYNHFEDCKEDIDACSLNNQELRTLFDIFNKRYDEKLYKSLLKQGFFKLSFKWKLHTHTPDWSATYYWKFLEDNK